jgi:hypothetical protein
MDNTQNCDSYRLRLFENRMLVRIFIVKAEIGVES